MRPGIRAPKRTLIDDAQLRALIEDSLYVWRVRGIVAAAPAPAIAAIHAGDGTMLTVEKADGSDGGVRWWVRWLRPGYTPMRSRPCTSVAMLLRTVRSALGAAPGGSRLRIAPGGDP